MLHSTLKLHTIKVTSYLDGMYKNLNIKGLEIAVYMKVKYFIGDSC